MTLHTPRPLSPAASSRAGFTLIELLIVIAILGLLAAVLLPVLIGTKNTADEAATDATMLQLSQACNVFSNKHGFYPPDDLKDPENKLQLKPDNGQNTGIESFVVFTSQSMQDGVDLSGLAEHFTNTDKDENGTAVPLLKTKERRELADAWKTPFAYFTKFGVNKTQQVTGANEEPLAAKAKLREDGSWFGTPKFQFLSAGKDGTFGTSDDRVWPAN